MTEENETSTRELPTGSSGPVVVGSSGNCTSQGWVVFKWEDDHFEPESLHCKPGFDTPPAPVPSTSDRLQLATYTELRAIVCCVSGGSSSS